MKKRIFIYIGFFILFWVPFYILVKQLELTENTALIASLVGVIPLLFLFSSSVERLFERLSGVKVGNVELAFQEAISESLTSEGTENVSISLDTGREVIYGKGGMEDFEKVIRRFMPRPESRLVLLVDLKEEGYVDIPMLYFQTKHLVSLFDLRALLFVDTSENHIERRFIGTLTPANAIERMDDYSPEMGKAFDELHKEFKEIVRQGDIEGFIREMWGQFTNRAIGQLRLTKGVFRLVFADGIETNIVEYPLKEEDYPSLLAFLEPKNTHLILVQNGEVVNVRTIDRVAREIARKSIRAALSQKRSNKTPKPT